MRAGNFGLDVREVEKQDREHHRAAEGRHFGDGGGLGTLRASCMDPTSLRAGNPSLLHRRRTWSRGQRGWELNDAIPTKGCAHRGLCWGLAPTQAPITASPLTVAFLHSHWGFFWINFPSWEWLWLSAGVPRLWLPEWGNAPGEMGGSVPRLPALVPCSLSVLLQPRIQIPSNCL